MVGPDRTSDFAIERATVDDWQRLKETRLRALADTPDAFGSMLKFEEDLTQQQWQERLANTEVVTFLLRQKESGDIGIAVGAPYSSRDGAGLFSMWIAPEVRGRRLGGLLINAVIDWAEESGYGALRLDVGDHNQSAIRLYERTGFVASGESGTLDPPREHITEHEMVLKLT